MKTRDFAIIVGQPQDLTIAQGEDCLFRFTFREPGATTDKDFSDIQASKMTARDRNGIPLFARDYKPSASTTTRLAYEVVGADTAAAAVQPYSVDIQWFAQADNSMEQLLIGTSSFRVVPAPGKASDVVTSAPPIPLVYGLNWRGAWSGAANYNAQDAVTYPDPNGGGSNALSSFRCVAPNINTPPINLNGTVNASWVYIAERGADGSGGGVSRKATFSVVSGLYEQVVTWPDFGTVPDVIASLPVTDSVDAVICQVKDVTSVGCVVTTDVLFDGYVRLSIATAI